MTRSRFCHAAAWCAAILLFLPLAQAAVVPITGNLDGLQEVPPNASPAIGFVDATLDNSSGLFSISTGTYSDLLGTSIAITLNDAAVGATGPVISVLTLDTPGATSGTFSGSATLTAPQIADMLAGNTYVNLRSTVFPSGEIRGQLFTTPEPGSLTLLVLGATGAIFAARRQRRQAR